MLLMQTLAQEVAANHMRVNGIAQGAIRTLIIDAGMTLYSGFGDNG